MPPLPPLPPLHQSTDYVITATSAYLYHQRSYISGYRTGVDTVIHIIVGSCVNAANNYGDSSECVCLLYAQFVDYGYDVAYTRRSLTYCINRCVCVFVSMQ